MSVYNNAVGSRLNLKSFGISEKIFTQNIGIKKAQESTWAFLDLFAALSAAFKGLERFDVYSIRAFLTLCNAEFNLLTFV